MIAINKENLEVMLYSFAHGYACSLHSHFNPSEPGFDTDAYNYLYSQAHFVYSFPERAAHFLMERGVSDSLAVEVKYLQYFFGIIPPVHTPYMELWRFCFEQMFDEGMLPAKARETIDRLISGRNKHKLVLHGAFVEFANDPEHRLKKRAVFEKISPGFFSIPGTTEAE